MDYQYMYCRQDPVLVPLRLLALLRLPVDLGVCLGAEIIAWLALSVDAAGQQHEGRRFPTSSELSGVGHPTLALCLVLRPHLPAFKHTVCDGARSGRDACWAAFDTQTKDAAKLVKETEWLKVAQAMLWWFLFELRRIKKVHLRGLFAKLKNRFLLARGKPVPEAANAGISRAQVLEMLAEAGRVQCLAQMKISVLVREAASGSRHSMSFLEAHQKIVELDLPKDPLSKHGLTEADLPELFNEYEHDNDVMVAAGQLLSPAARGDLVVAEKITLEKIIQIHQRMELRMKLVLEEFTELPAAQRDSMPRKERENTAELLVATAVECEFGIHCEDVEMAVMLHDEELQSNPEFVRCSEQLTVLVQGLMGTVPAG